MAGLFDIFGSNPTVQHQQAPQQQHVQQQNQQQPGGKGPVDQNGQPIDALKQSPTGDPTMQNGTKQGEESPMDFFKDLFNIKEDDAEDQFDPEADYFPLDPTKLGEQVSSTNFVQGDNFEDLMQNALKGDVKSMQNMLNGVAQNVFKQAIMMSAKISDKTARESYSRTQRVLPDTLKSLISDDEVSNLNPMFKHPAMAPVIKGIKKQIQQAYPNAGPKELTEMTNRYLTSMTKMMAGTDDQQDTKKQSGNQMPDFGEFFNLPKLPGM